MPCKKAWSLIASIFFILTFDPALMKIDIHASIGSVEVVPANPTENDNITLTVYGDFGDTCWNYMTGEYDVWDRIIINLYTEHVGEVCLPFLVPYSDEFNIGQLTGGYYPIEVQEYQVIDGYNVLIDTYYSDLFVTPGDSDGDGVMSDQDNCPTMPNGPYRGTCTWSEMQRGNTCLSNSDCGADGLCSMNQDDMDSDGAGDVCDNCPHHSNPEQNDTLPPGGNGIGDACECEGNFDCDDDVDGTDAAIFKRDFGRSPFVNPCASEDPCNGNFDCDQDADGSNAAQFKTDFGRSQFKNSCGSCNEGEWCAFYVTTSTSSTTTTVSTTTTIMPRFIDNGDGTVTDQHSNLVWLKNANCYGYLTLYEATDIVAALATGSCGLNDGSNAADWRLPTKEEWENFVCPQYQNPVLCNTAGDSQWQEGDPFDNVLFFQWEDAYWSSTQSAIPYNWCIYLADGFLGGVIHGNTELVWPVRGGQ